MMAGVGCSSSGEGTAQINYAALDTLQTEGVLEIGESEAYLPGNLTGVVVTRGGELLVADWASSTIEQFDAQGTHRATVAASGGGPGELADYFWMYPTSGDTVLVNQQFTQKDIFVPGPDGIYRFVRSESLERMPDRSFTIIGVQSDTSYYATVNQIYSSAGISEAEKQRYSTRVLAVVNGQAELLEDSVQTYKTANPYVQREGNSIMIRPVPFRLDDDIAVRGDGRYLVARIDSSAIYHYNARHELEQKIPLNVKTRPVTGRDLEYELEEMERGPRNEVEAMIGDQKPIFLNMYATADYIWLHTDTGTEGKEFVVLDYQGKPLGKFLLPDVDRVQHVAGTRIYTIHESPDRGDLVRVYQVNL